MIIALSQEMIRTGQPAEAEWRVVWPDGSVHWIAGRGQVLMDESGEPSRMIGVNIDITESKQAEQALHEMNRALEEQSALLQSREELLEIFVRNVPAPVAMLDREMRYVQVSERWCTDYLPGRAQVLGRSHYEIFPDIPERWKEVHRRALQGETLRADEDRWDGQGGPHWARWEVRPWKTPEGIVGGILIFAEDITRRKQMEEALSQLSRKLINSQEQDRSRIGRDLHDDINQKLALLAVDIDQLRKQTPNSAAEIGRGLSEIRSRIDAIAADVQSISHQLHSPQLEILGIVAASRGFCREFAAHQKVAVDFTHDNIPKGVSHEVALCLFRVLQEALHNAVKHSNVRHYEVRLGYSGSEVHLRVSDRGTGFNAEAAMSSGGLGLVSMRERVRLVNGTIGIKSTPMGGTTIDVRVPFQVENYPQQSAS
jgi:PAS domain S-box-containing protein